MAVDQEYDFTRVATGAVVLVIALFVTVWFGPLGASDDVEAPERPVTTRGSVKPTTRVVRKVPVDSLSEAALEDAYDEEPKPQSAPADPDAKKRDWFVGNWETNHQAHRTMVVNKDGTGTMSIHLDGLGARLFGKRIDVEIEWMIEDGKMTQKLIRGEPAGKVAAMKRMFGDVRTWSIREMTSDALTLAKEGDDDSHTWIRAEPVGRTAIGPANSAQ